MFPPPPRSQSETLDLMFATIAMPPAATLTKADFETFVATLRDGCPPRPDPLPTEEPEQ